MDAREGVRLSRTRLQCCLVVLALTMAALSLSLARPAQRSSRARARASAAHGAALADARNRSARGAVPATPTAVDAEHADIWALALKQDAEALAALPLIRLEAALRAQYRRHSRAPEADQIARALHGQAEGVVQLLVDTAYVARARAVGCEGGWIDRIHATLATARAPCAAEPSADRGAAELLRGAWDGERARPCSDLLHAELAEPTSCAGAGVTLDQEVLPYSWLPVLPFYRAPEAYYANCSRFEVTHLYDSYPGPPWVYAAPGSGVWWSPRACRYFTNSVDAALSLAGVRATAAHVAAQREEPEYWQWRLLFGDEPWESVLRKAARGVDRYAHIAVGNGEFFSALLTAPEQLDSIVLRRQLNFGNPALAPFRPASARVSMHFWFDPRTSSCADRAALRTSLFFVPEAIDYGAAREEMASAAAAAAKAGGAPPRRVGGNREPERLSLTPGDGTPRPHGRALTRHVSADRVGDERCDAGVGVFNNQCVACSARMRAACKCRGMANVNHVHDYNATLLAECCAKKLGSERNLLSGLGLVDKATGRLKPLHERRARLAKLRAQNDRRSFHVVPP